MTPGDKFQNNFVASLSPKLTCVRLNDSRKGLKHERNPGDYIVFNARIMHFIELKTSLGNSMSIGEKKGYNIHPHQIDLVVEYGNKPNCFGYFILNYREKERTFRIVASDLKFMHERLKKKSISVIDCDEYGYEIEEYKERFDLSFLK